MEQTEPRVGLLSRRFQFIAPTRPLRELGILGQIARGHATSLRSLADESLLGRTMVHKYVSEMQANGLISIEGRSLRDHRYRITEDGACRLDELLHRASQEVVQLYGLLKAEFRSRLAAQARQGARRVVLFGAAETAELVQAAAEGTGLEIVGAVDSDPKKQGRWLGPLRVEAPERLLDYACDTVVITSFGYAQEIYERIRHVEERGVRVVRL